MKDKYFKIEKVLMVVSVALIGYIFIGCVEPKLGDKEPFFKVEGDNVEYICNSNGYWYKRTGTTKIQIIKSNGKYLTCTDERL